MKTYIDRLRECPVEMLENEIKSQKATIKIIQRDLKIQERVLTELNNKEAK